MKNYNEESSGSRSFDTGFWFVLTACVVVLALTAYLLFVKPVFSDADSLSKYEYESDVSVSDAVTDIPMPDTQTIAPSDEPDEEDSDDQAADDSAEQDEDEDEDVEDAEDDEEDEETDEDEPDDTQTAAPADTMPTFTLPMKNAVVSRPYTVDALKYDQTMEDWRTHAAVDYKGTKGEEVLSVADGTVQEIGTNTLYGQYIVLRHSDKVISRYAGIADPTVSEGETVTAGQVIAQLGAPMPAEAKQGVHLHLEVIESGHPINPAS